MRISTNARRGLCNACVLLAVALHASAGALVTFTAAKANDGSFDYTLTVKNTDPTESISGVIILHGDTVFGLHAASDIVAPTDWSFFAPVPQAVDDLFYYSLMAAADIPPGGTLEDFTFNSLKNYGTLQGNDFAVEVISSKDGRQISAGNALFVPEPSAKLMTAGGLVLAAVLVRLRRKDPRCLYDA